ncbi:MAG: carbohydrate ABC transporter permease [Actinomyces urogenitalis]|uniref:carbohydrate ABC transporter permease n=1 Tax=Actinomyces urogenitalis TaxID=103621 RepID=UPI000660DFEF|nr:carbohydrate ABC transporter permease [Actinomyces urogenitalis]MBS6071329.1 carbohydrate ABC transporter permease [Actinomyces urogenitalis]
MRRSTNRTWFHMVLGLFFLALMLFPVYWMVNASLQPGVATVDLSWFPVRPSLDGYRSAFASQGANLVTSLVVAVGATVLSLVISTPAAYALSLYRVRGSGLVMFALLISQMIPGIVIANALYSAYNDLGILNTTLGLILADSALGVPFSILIIQAFMRAIPMSVLEAARVDGAGRFRTFFSIVLPLSTNAVITAALFSFLFAWSDFLFALTLNSNSAARPVTLGIYQFIGGYVADWGSVMATATMASLPAAVLLVVAQKYVAAGATGGAVKA